MQLALRYSSPPGISPIISLHHSSMCCLLINLCVYSGEKADVLARVLAGDRTYPSARIASGSVTWLVDEAAAARVAAPTIDS